MRLKLLGLALVSVCLLALGCGGSGGGDRSGESASTTSSVITATSTPTRPTTAVVTTTAGELAGGGSGGLGVDERVGVVSSGLGLGVGHGCVLVGGGVGCWGANGSGELGLGGVSGVEGYVSSVVGVSDVVSVVSGGSHSCALERIGGVFCWGSNVLGQLGFGSDVEFSDVPVRAVGVSDAVAVAAGSGRFFGHSCVVHSDGGVSCWGNNSVGQLGNGESGSGVFSLLPQRVLGISDAVDVSAGAGRSCVLRSGGGVSCWGYETMLREDDVEKADGSVVPVEMVGVSGAVEVSVGEEFACAVTGSGEVLCWGNNNMGQLGDGSFGSSFVPVKVVGISDAVLVSAGDSHACAVHRGGEVSCWGENSDGRLGAVPEVLLDISDFKSNVPVKVVGISDAIEVDASVSHSCVLHIDRSVSCWGSNLYGQLGRMPSAEATQVLNVDDAVEVYVSRYYSCVRHRDGAVSCWGQNNRGQLGDGTRNSSAVPLKIVGVDDAVGVVVENFFGRNGFTCALRESGSVSCWGFNSFGNLGNGQSSGDEEDTSADALVPVTVSGINDAADLDISWYHACAVHEEGRVSCWGSNLFGRLGNGRGTEEEGDTTEDSAAPVSVSGLSEIIEVELGAVFSCALGVDGRVLCWGNDSAGELGNGQEPFDEVDEVDFSAVPVEAVGISDAMSVSASTFSTCALLGDASLSCWGWNLRSQLGKNSLDAPILSEPTKMEGVSGVVSVVSSEADLGEMSKCALILTGEVYCLGANTYGKLGNGLIEWRTRTLTYDSAIPTKVLGLSDATAITAGSNHYCALIADGTVWCWGRNNSVQRSIYRDQDLLAASGEPVQVPNVSDAISISSSYDHTCAVIADGTVKCWGDNLFGQLGNGYAGYLPTKVPGLDVSG